MQSIAFSSAISAAFSRYGKRHFLSPNLKCSSSINRVYEAVHFSSTGHALSDYSSKEFSSGSTNTLATGLKPLPKIRQKCQSRYSSMHLQALRHTNPLIPTKTTAPEYITKFYPFGSFIRPRLRSSKGANICLPLPFPCQIRNFKSPTVTSATSGSDGFTREHPAKAMRRILQTPGLHQGPACFDALSAKLVEKAGFEFCITSGFSVSATRLALPDAGLISYGEMIDQGSQITGAVSIPVIGDGDTGYGNALNVKRTVKGYIRAGFAGILLEDQVSPKACGHTRGRKVVSREEAIMHIKAAVDARKESSSDIVIIARTDARQAVSLEESLWRVQAFADAGADVLFIDALASREEMQAFCNISPQVPKLANMLEGGGKTPLLSPIELEEIGFKIVCYPLSLLGVSIRAMQDALSSLKSGRIPPPASLPSFEEIKEVIGFNDYYEEEKHYFVNEQPVAESNAAYSGQISEYKKEGDNSQELNVEIMTPKMLEDSTTRSSHSGIRSLFLRVKITASDGTEKLHIRIPAGFLEGLANIVPAVAGLNLEAILDDVVGETAGGLKGNLKKQKKLIDFNDKIGDRIEVFLE
eukprot:Gb_35353 [translate_table: standard]